MDASEYQKLAARTLIGRPGFEISDQDLMTVWDCIGLAGEVGEICDLIQEGIFRRHGRQHGINLQQLKKEVGDACWHLAAICSTNGLDLSEIMQANIDKLWIRYPNGYSSDDSQRRADLAGSGSREGKTNDHQTLPAL